MLRIFLLIVLLVNLSFGAKKVFFSVDNTAYIWKEIQVNQLKNEFAKYKDIEFSYNSSVGNVAQQVNDLEKAIENKVDAIILSPVDAQVVTNVVEKAYDAGIKIIFAIRSANTDKFHTYIHPDDKLIAQAAARYIIKTVKNPKVIMIQGRVGANTVKNRKEGFEEIFHQNPNAQIVAIETGNYQADEALAIMDRLITSNLDFNAVYTHNDAMQQGVRIALKTNGYDFKKITLVGIDYIKDAQEAIRKGQMDATFIYPTSYKEIVKYTRNLLEGKKVEKDIVVPSRLITRENIDKIQPLF